MNIFTMQIQAAERKFSRARGEYAKRMARRELIQALTAAVLDRDGPQCRYCLIETQPTGPDWQLRTVDHVVPTSRGGTDTLDNLIIACRTCNCRRGARPIHEFARIAL